MKHLLCGILGALALSAATPSQAALVQSDLVQTVQYRPEYGNAHPDFHHRRYYRPHFHRPIFHRPIFHRGPPRFRH